MTAYSTLDLAQIGVLAAAALGTQCGFTTTLLRPQLLKDATRTLVVRYAAVRAGAPDSSVIVKVIRDDPAIATRWAALASERHVRGSSLVTRHSSLH
jgi:hypothetical protein